MLDRDKYLSEKEVQRLLGFIAEKVKTSKKRKWQRRHVIIQFLVNTGCRASETRLLKIRDADLNREEPMVFVRAENSKNGKGRSIPISQALRICLKKFKCRKREWGESLSDDSYFFLNQRGSNYSLGGIQRLFKQVAEEAGLRPVYSIHSTRHSYGYATYKASKSIRLVQTLLGHSSLQSTMVYAHVDPQEMVKVVNEIWT